MGDLRRDHQRKAGLIFSRLVRDPAIREYLGGDPVRAVVCLESDSLSSMLDSLAHRYAAGAPVAIYYPESHRFRFMWWGPSGSPELGTADEEIKGAPGTTVGMAIAAIEAETYGWTSSHAKLSARGIKDVPTTQIERALAAV